jgi:hypothetical protein
MNDFNDFFERLQLSLSKDEFVKLTLSKPIRKSEGLLNVYVRLFKIDDKDVFELKYRHEEENKFKQFSLEELKSEIESLLLNKFRTGCLFTLSEDLIVLVSKKKLVSYRDNAPSFKNKLPEVPLES